MKKLNRAADERKALLRGLTTELIRHGRIKTTLVRCKAVRKTADHMVTLAKGARDPFGHSLHPQSDGAPRRRWRCKLVAESCVRGSPSPLQMARFTRGGRRLATSMTRSSSTRSLSRCRSATPSARAATRAPAGRKPWP